MGKYIVVVLVVFSARLSIAQSGIGKVDSLLLNSAFDQAIQTLDEIEKRTTAVQEKNNLQNKRAEIFIAQGLFDQAEKLLAQLKTSSWSTPQAEAAYLDNLGYLSLNKGRQDLALEYLQKAYTLLSAGNQGLSREAARSLSFQCLTYFASGKYNQAADNAMIALQIRQKLYGDDHEEVAASYNDLGLVYSRIDADQALAFYDKALPIYERLHGDEHAKIAIINSNMGAIYRQLKLYGDAITNFETALNIWRKLYPNGHPNEAFVLRNLGQTYSNMGNHALAYQYFNQALAGYQKVYGSSHPDIASLLNQIATLQLSDEEYLTALGTLQKAIQSNIPAYLENDIYKAVPIHAYYSSRELLFSLQQKAKAFEGLHFGKTLKVSDLKASLSSLLLCDSLIEDIRHHSTDESDKLSFGSLANEVYEDGVRVAMALSEASVIPRPYLELAFYFAENSKSAVLQESIADAQAKSFSGIPNELLIQEKELKASIAFLSQRLSQKPEKDEETYLRETIFQLNRDYQTFTLRLEKEYPNYFNLKYSSASPKVSELQAQLNQEQALVSYFIAEQGQRIYQFMLTSKSFRVKSYSLPADFERSIKGLVNGIYYRDFASYQKSSDKLQRVLIPHVPAGISEVLLIPAGRLGTVPFEALPIKMGSDFSSTRFVIDRFAISYEFSAGLLMQKGKATTSDSKRSIFLCAPVEFPEKDNLNDLPGTESEVNNIAALFPSGNKLVRTHADASESIVKSGDLKNYKYLHFATHGVVDEVDPGQSRIFLNTNDHEDGNLFAGEIYNLSLDADLAVLSACQTGLGKYSKGEGVIGLSRALVYAGARNLIVSFWSVSDASTAQLMSDFYSQLLKQSPPNFRTALQKAKLSMIGSKEFREPYYWAPFIVIGF